MVGVNLLMFRKMGGDVIMKELKSMGKWVRRSIVILVVLE